MRRIICGIPIIFCMEYLAEWSYLNENLIDAHMLGEAEGGNETYVAGLLRGLSRIELEKSIEICALVGPRAPESLYPLPPIRHFPIGSMGNAWRLLVEIPRACRDFNADVVHLTYNAPPRLGCPFVLTVHDVIFRVHPEFFSPRVRLLLNTIMPLSMRKAHTILTVSETSRRDIEHYYPFTRGKVVVIPNAPGPVSWIEPDYDSVKLWSKGSPFILAVGTVQPRKNLVRLIQAYILLQTTGSVRARLLIVGRHAWQSQIIREAVKQSPEPDDIVFLGYVDDPTLAALYHSCDVFAYPSLYEGFGLPVVEAMACGAPVVTSNTSSLPEVAGGAAVLVDPHSTEEIAKALAKVLNSSSMREEFCERGRQWVARFSWENSARRIMRVMVNAAEDKD